ncbi:MAG: cytidylate kinase-like family protein [Frisingicoccus sp.]|nr:cytidylate kinase-like family protein [Frisingicoccus sp.]
MQLVITMSRRYGTGASVIAKELSERLGVPVYDKADVEQEVRKNAYETEAEAIRELAEEPCIILGRCASEILKDQSNVINIYVCAEKEDRIQRIMKQDQLSYEDAVKRIEETDAEREKYYNQHTGRIWGDVTNYHVILDTSKWGIENCADVLIQYLERMQYI